MIPSAPLPVADLLDSFNGLPTHPLVVHFTVVLASVAAVSGVVYALVPRFRRWLSMPLLALGVASIALGLITPATGENLEARIGESALLDKHTELGDQMGTILIVYGIVLILTMLVVRFRPRKHVPQEPTPTATDTAAASPATAPAEGSRPADRKPIDRVGGLPGYPLRAFPGQPQVAAVLTILVLIGAIASGVMIYRTGDSGAKSVWNDTPAAAPEGNGGR